ncbi:MAG: aspartate kinase [Bacteroidales bacterium]|nr:aspartate kinase [Bacteroidales bacterium]
MQIFKFGGASVKNADAVRNIAQILGKFNENIVVVVSAMGKTTNALEQITGNYFHGNIPELEKNFENLKAYHYYIMNGLFRDENHPVYEKVKKLFTEMAERFTKKPTLNFDFDYDQIVCYGELLSTVIVAAYLNEAGIPTQWMDIRESLKTDNKFREGTVDWELSAELVSRNFVFNGNHLFLTQGFLGSTVNNLTTTLGREGSDYTAAILANLLDAQKVVIWKDVPGVLNADPKWFDDTVLLEHLSYMDAIELAYYGASVIHPKTIQPLKKKGIPLQVKSFVDYEMEGTTVGLDDYERLIPSFIFKMDQVLIHISTRDFSFVTEDYLSVILGSFARNGLNINLMQNTAISFQVCVNRDENRLARVLNDLREQFNVETESNLELVTIRYFDQETINRVTVGKKIILEQHNRTVAQMVMCNM